MLTPDGRRLPDSSHQWLWRILPASIVVLAFGFLSTLFLQGNTEAYSTILWQLGIDPFYFPFLDSHGVLSTAECHRYGFDVLVENPCDVLGRTLDYSPFWLLTAKLGLHTGMTQIAGLTLDLLFLFWIFFLPAARSPTQAVVLTLALLSSDVGLALERANLDVAIFVIGIVAANWALRGAIWRVFGYAFIILGALVKYYPGVLLILAIRERLLFLIGLASATILITVIFVATEYHDLIRALAQIENGSWFTMSFGAQNLARGIAQLLPPAAAPFVPVMAIELLLVLVTTSAATAIARSDDLHACFDYLPTKSQVFLLGGCALIVACFFAAQNGLYRGIYFLFVIPPLTQLYAAPISRAGKQRFALAISCVLFAMWSSFLYRGMNEILAFFHVAPDFVALAHMAFWLSREIIWWWIISILLSFLLCLIYRSRSGQEILHLLLPEEKLSIRSTPRAMARLAGSGEAKHGRQER